MPRPKKRRRYPKPKPVTIRHVEPGRLDRSPGPARVVKADHFERAGALRLKRERRRVVNLGLRPDDEVTLPELTLSLRWWVVSVDRAAGQAKLRTIIFETPQSFTVEIENVEWEPHMEGMEDAA